MNGPCKEFLAAARCPHQHHRRIRFRRLQSRFPTFGEGRALAHKSVKIVSRRNRRRFFQTVFFHLTLEQKVFLHHLAHFRHIVLNGKGPDDSAAEEQRRSHAGLRHFSAVDPIGIMRFPHGLTGFKRFQQRAGAMIRFIDLRHRSAPHIFKAKTVQSFRGFIQKQHFPFKITNIDGVGHFVKDRRADPKDLLPFHRYRHEPYPFLPVWFYDNNLFLFCQ